MFKDKQYELVVKYYSLAMNYVPQTTENIDKLSAVLLSNRCAAYLNLEMYDKALEDAKRCVQIEPEWSKVMYRNMPKWLMECSEINKDHFVLFHRSESKGEDLTEFKFETPECNPAKRVIQHYIKIVYL